MTPSGITKTICVYDNAIPGIENAAEHSDRTIITAQCPCLDVWDGAPYPEGTLVDGAPSTLPNVIPTDAICTEVSNDIDTQLTISVYVYGDGDRNDTEYNAAISRSSRYGFFDQCGEIDTVIGESVWLETESGQQFSDVAISQDGLITSAMMDACKAVLVARGCVFQ